MITNLTLKSSTRQTSHLGSKCAILKREARIGEDMGLLNKIAYTVRDMDKVYVVRVNYYNEDGTDNGYFGDVLGNLVQTNDGKTIILRHVSRDGSEWEMIFERN